MKHRKLKKIERIFRSSLVFMGVLPIFLLPFEQVAWAAAEIKATSGRGKPLSSYSPSEHSLSEYKGQDLNAKTLSKTWQAYKLPHKFTPSLLTKLPVLSNGQSGMVSNATNFHGAWGTSVDPRTGTVSFSTTIAGSLYNHGNSRRDLMLSYSGSPSPTGPNPFDLGNHWQWNVGMETPSATEVMGHQTTSLSTGDGHGFTMVSDRDENGLTIWHPRRHKLHDVKITGHPGDWLISISTGIRERIVNGYEQWEEDRLGNRVYFYYDRDGSHDNIRHLTYICAHQLTGKQLKSYGNECKNDGVHVTYLGGDVIVHSKQRIVLHRRKNGITNIIDRITMPALSSKGIIGSSPAIISFGYDDNGKRPWLINRVLFPSGISKTFLYNEESTQNNSHPHGLKTGIHGQRLPVVTEEITKSEKTGENKVPAMHVWYQYNGPKDQDEHNYLGYQEGGSISPGKDNLFDRPSSYRYSVVTNNGLTYTVKEFNKYHLPVKISQYSSQENALLAQSESDYIPLQGTTFDKLPAIYSLPKGSTKTLYKLTEKGNYGKINSVRVTEKNEYDNNGNIIWHQDAYGRVTKTQWCPPQGDMHCPAADPSWPIFKPEKVLMLPSTHNPEKNSRSLMLDKVERPESAVIITYNYIKIHRQQNPLKLLQATADYQLLPSSDFEMSAKTTGIVPVASVINLKKNDPVPEVSDSNISTRTSYHYNTLQNDDGYGQLDRMTVTKKPEHAPVLHGKTLMMTKIPAQENLQEKLSFSIHRIVDKKLGTRTTIMSALPDKSSKSYADAKTLAGIGSGQLVLGTTVSAIDTGVTLSKEDVLGESTLSWEYDEWNRPVKEIRTLKNSNAAPKINTWTYITTPEENAVVKTLSDGKQLKNVMAANGNPLSSQHRFAYQADATVQGKSNWIPDTKMTYTSFNALASETFWHAGDPQADGTPGKPIALTTTYGYDILNRPVWTKTPDGLVSIVVHDDPSMRILSYTVAAAGKNNSETPDLMLKVMEANILGLPKASYILPLNPDIKKSGKYLYSPELKDQLKALNKQLLPVSSLQVQNSFGLLPVEGKNGLLSFVSNVLGAGAWLSRMTMQYDGHGRKVSQTKGNGATTRWHYSRGNMVATTTPDGRVIHDTINLRGQKTSRCVQPVGTGKCHTLGIRRYDMQGQLYSEEDEYGNATHYEYDGDGRLIKQVTPATKEAPAGHTITYRYNMIGLAQKSLDGRVVVTYAYDQKSRALTDKEDSISHVHYDYDSKTGALARITHSAPENKGLFPAGAMHYPEYTEEIAYDRYMQTTKTKDSAGNIYTIEHDDLGRPVNAYVKLPGKTTPVLLSHTSFDPFNRPSIITNGAGIQAQLTYNSLGQLEKTQHTVRGKVIDSTEYTYNPDTSNILTMIREEGSESATQAYAYDKADNLTMMVCHKTGTDSASILCPHDIDLNNSNLLTPPIITRQLYAFDKWNNIQKVTESGVTDLKNPEKYTKVTQYRYASPDENDHSDSYDPNRLIGYQTQWNTLSYSVAPKNIEYDQLGRIITDAEGNQLHYDASGHQDSFVNAGTHEVTRYTYNSDGHQVAEQPFTAQNKALQAPLYMLYNGNGISAQVQEDANHKTHMSTEIGQIARSEDGVITDWYVHDYRGNVINRFSPQGTRLSDNVYSPYGMQYDLMNKTPQGLSQNLVLANQQNWWQTHRPGFDGQMSDPATGYQFLGGGYRAYNPVYRHFMAKDSFSPFIKVDGYGFGDNNPIMNTDPSGHMSKNCQYVMAAMVMAVSVVSAVLLPVSAAFGAATTGASVLGMIGGSALTAITSVSGAASGTLGLVAGGLQMGEITHPGNKTLAMASEGFSIAAGIAAIPMGAGITGIGADVVTTGIGTLNRITGYSLVASGVSAGAAGLSGATQSSMGLAVTADKNLASTIMRAAMDSLGYATMVLTGISIITGGVVAVIHGVSRYGKIGLSLEGDYIGQTLKGERHGYGTLYSQAAEGEEKEIIAQGVFHKGKLVEGWMTKDGVTTEGRHVNEQLEGPGKMSFADNREVKGIFENGQAQNQVKGRVPGEMRDVNTTIQYGNRKYVGPVQNNVPEGKGTMYYDGGGSYTGDFKNGVPHGPGLLHSSGGGTYKGTFEEGKMLGEFSITENGNHRTPTYGTPTDVPGMVLAPAPTPAAVPTE